MVKRVLLALIIFALMSCAIACDNESTAVTNLESITTTTVIATPPPTLTPKPTLSEEEIRIKQEYNDLVDICEKYNDWSAVLLIREMYKAGKISENYFKSLNSIEAFNGMKDYNEETWGEYESQIRRVSDILNGKSKDEGFIYEHLSRMTKYKTVYVMLFDTEEKRENIIFGVSCINAWFLNPSKEKFNSIKQIYFSDKLTPGEILVLSCYIQYHPDKPSVVLDGDKKIDLEDYLKKNGILELSQNALKMLI